MQSLVNAIENGSLEAHIAVVISDQPEAAGLTWAAERNIPTAVINRKKYSEKSAFEAAIAESVHAHRADWVILAGFMRVLSSQFVDIFKNKILNIHPSRLPKFKGLNTHCRAIQAKETEHGASVHFVTAQLDAGAVIIQSSVTLNLDDNEHSLAARVLQTEHIIFPIAVQWVISGKVKCLDDSLFKEGQLLEHPVQWASEN